MTVKKFPPLLYSFALSPFVQKVSCYLLYKKIPFNTWYVNHYRYKQELPIGHQVPVLTIDGESRNESTEIGLWLDEEFPDAPKLIPDLKQKAAFLAADKWVTERLIPYIFMYTFIGSWDSWWVKARKRLSASRVLNGTIKGGVSPFFRLMHMLKMTHSPMARELIRNTDTSMPLQELRTQLAEEFEQLLGDGPFLCESPVPTLADLSALPQIIVPRLRGDGENFLQSPAILDWVERMEKALPDYRDMIPAVARSNSYQ